MPEIVGFLVDSPFLMDIHQYRFDVKVHMLMPEQWPCIPNWHCDFVPRDEQGSLKYDLIPDNPLPMYLWLSGPPLTVFEDGRKVEPGSWVQFTQKDFHRGVKSKDFQWRIFIRAVPESLLPEKVLALAGLRRHSQVYVENDFTW